MIFPPSTTLGTNGWITCDRSSHAANGGDDVTPGEGLTWVARGGEGERVTGISSWGGDANPGGGNPGNVIMYGSVECCIE